MIKYADVLAGKGISSADLGEVMLYSTFFLFPKVLPIAILLAALIAFGTLGEHNELTAIKSAGVSLLKIIAPVFIFVVMISGALYVYNDVVLPKANIRALTLMFDLTHKQGAFNLREGGFTELLKKYSIKVDKIHDDGERIDHVMIYPSDTISGAHNQRNTRLIIADSGRIHTTEDEMNLIVDLYHGREYREDAQIMQWSDYKKKQNLAVAYSEFEHSRMVIDISELALQRTPKDRFMGNKQMLTYDQLWAMADSFDVKYQKEKEGMGKHLNSKLFYHYQKPNDKIDISGFDTTKIDVSSPKTALLAKQYTQGVKSAGESHKATLDQHRKNGINYKIEAWYRYNSVASCILLFIIGASIGAIVKKGGLGMPALIAILIFVVYYILTMQGQKLTKELILDVEVGMMICNMVMLPVAVITIVFAANDTGFGKLNPLRYLPRASFPVNPRELNEAKENAELDHEKFTFLINNLNYLSKRQTKWEDLKQTSDFLDDTIEYLSENIKQEELRQRLRSIPDLKEGLESFKGYYYVKKLGGGTVYLSFFVSLFLAPLLIPFAIYKSKIEKNGNRRLYNIFFVILPPLYFWGWLVYKFFEERDYKHIVDRAIQQLTSIQMLSKAES